eukprot:scaffold224224_cov28-Tisochrysis_lutea.AAC.5
MGGMSCREQPEVPGGKLLRALRAYLHALADQFWNTLDASDHYRGHGGDRRSRKSLHHHRRLYRSPQASMPRRSGDVGPCRSASRSGKGEGRRHRPRLYHA